MTQARFIYVEGEKNPEDSDSWWSTKPSLAGFPPPALPSGGKCGEPGPGSCLGDTVSVDTNFSLLDHCGTLLGYLNSKSAL